MKLLIDNALSHRLALLLREAGIDTVHVGELGIASADDLTVLSRAATEGRVLVSADVDFGFLLAESGSSAPSFVLWRATPRRAEAQAPILMDIVATHADELNRGAIVVVQDDRVRVRLLPVRPPT